MPRIYTKAVLIKMVCKNCNKTFFVKKKGSWKTRKYCSIKCSNLSKIGRIVIFTTQWKKKLSLSAQKRTGEKSPRWKGGKTPINERIRKSLAYQVWRKQVIKKNKFLCQTCRSKENLQVDHIKPFAIFIELRFDINNGQVLCKNCHKIKTKKDLQFINKSYLKEVN